jgi:5,10-methylenetetrahydrofolate reductase
MAGIELSGKPDFIVGSMVNAGLQGIALDQEIDAMKRKMDAGARFFITPPLFDISSIEPFMNKINTSDVHIIPTVMLLKSLGMARYMSRNMKHVYITDELVKRIQKAPDKVRECIRIAQESVSAVKKNGFSGAMISTIGWEDRLYDIIHGI